MIWFKAAGTNVHSRGVGFEVRNNRLSHSQKFAELLKLQYLCKVISVAKFSWNKRKCLTSCKIAKSLQRILGGAVCAALLFILIPLFAEGMSPSVAIAKMTNSPLKIISILETISIVGLVFGCVFSLFAWIGRRKREREETDELMREIS